MIKGRTRVVVSHHLAAFILSTAGFSLALPQNGISFGRNDSFFVPAGHALVGHIDGASFDGHDDSRVSFVE